MNIADKIDPGTGRIVEATFTRGNDLRTDNCEGCYCECHDDTPLPAGTYITVKLDNPNAPIGMARVVVSVLDEAVTR